MHNCMSVKVVNLHLDWLRVSFIFLLEPISSSTEFVQHCTVNIRLGAQIQVLHSLLIGQILNPREGLKVKGQVESITSGAIRAVFVLNKQSGGA